MCKGSRFRLPISGQAVKWKPRICTTTAWLQMQLDRAPIQSKVTGYSAADTGFHRQLCIQYCLQSSMLINSGREKRKSLSQTNFAVTEDTGLVLGPTHDCGPAKESPASASPNSSRSLQDRGNCKHILNLLVILALVPHKFIPNVPCIYHLFSQDQIIYVPETRMWMCPGPGPCLGPRHLSRDTSGIEQMWWGAIAEEMQGREERVPHLPGANSRKDFLRRWVHWKE